MNFLIKKLAANDLDLFAKLMTVFAEAFEDIESYQSQKPSKEYLKSLLNSETFICLVAICDDRVVGGLSAYVLPKFEQERKEIYLYDLAVSEQYRRKGIAKSLIQELQKIATQEKAYVIFVQADKGDDPAIALYQSLGLQEEVYHFDILPSIKG